METSEIIFVFLLAIFVLFQTFGFFARWIYHRRKIEPDQVVGEFTRRTCPNCGRQFGTEAFWVRCCTKPKWWISPVGMLYTPPGPKGFERFIIIGCHHCYRLFEFDRQGICSCNDGIPVSSDDYFNSLGAELTARAERERQTAGFSQ